jgi:hypothetical protein
LPAARRGDFPKLAADKSGFFAGLKADGREKTHENLQRLVVGAVGIEPTTSPV